MLSRSRRTDMMNRTIPCALACALLGSWPLAPSIADADEKRASPPAFQPTASLGIDELEGVVDRRSPDVEAARLGVDLARADRRQAGLTSNPILDFTWGTIPIGESNPKGLRDPIGHVPSYTVGLSYTIPLGKIAPKVDATEAALRGNEAQLSATKRSEAIELATVLGSLAASQLRQAGLHDLADDAAHEVEVAKGKLAAGFGTPLDVDKLAVEVTRSTQQVLSAESDRSESLAACAALVGATCQPFADAAEAKRFLDHFIDSVPRDPGRYASRPDLVALSAFGDEAGHEATLARNEAIPDPTVRLAYTHDTFLASGNQGDSLSLSLSFPLTFVDHGQALTQAAEAKRMRFASQRERLLSATEARVPALFARLDAQKKRRDALTTDALPSALRVLDGVEKTEKAQLVPVTELIQARRAVSELTIEQADSYADAFSAALEIHASSPPRRTAR